MDKVPAESSRFGKYILLERVGTGGMSEVFLAKTEGIEGFERKVALKRIFSSLTEHTEFVQSFIQEARVGGLLYHHNVVQTLDFGKCEGTYFIALEYVEGTHVGQLLHRCREERVMIPPGVYMQLALQICEGLDYIHHAQPEGTDLKLVHRDIKPSNMLISTQGLVKISDFGVAKAESKIGERTRVGSVKGTIGYMSPEQAMGAEVNPSSDLYSLGALLYEMATLKRLYGEGDELQLLTRVRDTNFAVPIEAAGAYIPGLDQVIRRLLQKDPRARYETAEQVAEALRGLTVKPADRSELVSFMRSLGIADHRVTFSGPRPKELNQILANQGARGAAANGRAETRTSGPRQGDARASGTPSGPRPGDQRATGAQHHDGRVSGPQPGGRPTMPADWNDEETGPAPTFAIVRGQTTGGGSARQSTLVALGVTLLAVGGAIGSYYLVDAQLRSNRQPVVSAVAPGDVRSAPVPPNAGPPVMVEVQTVPPGASVLVNGVLVAPATPAQVPVYEGQQVSLRLDGYQVWQQRVSAGPGNETQQWVVTLSPAQTH